jgi:hypothetical protein
MNIPVWLPWILVWAVIALAVWAVVHGGSKGAGRDDDWPGGMA